jgi:hypothetical protein
MPISCASRVIVAAGMPVMSAAHCGVQSFTRSCRSWNDGLTVVPSRSLNVPKRNGSAPGVCVTTGLSAIRSHHSVFCGS